MTPLPASPPLSGLLWSVIVPTLLFAVAALATYLLYQRFSAEAGCEGREGRPGHEKRAPGAGTGPERGAP